MQKYKTKKLFYNEYLYRVSIRCSLTYWFESPKFDKLSCILSQVSQQFDHSSSVTKAWSKIGRREIGVDRYTYELATAILDVLTSSTEYKLRRSGGLLLIYSSNLALINSLVAAARTATVDLVEPEPSNLSSLNAGKLIVSKAYSDFQYKLVLTDMADPTFPAWVDTQKGKLLMPAQAARLMENKKIVKTTQLYVRDDKMLTLVNMRLSSTNIQKIYEIVHK